MLVRVLVLVFRRTPKDGVCIVLVENLALKLKTGLLELLAKPLENIGCLGRNSKLVKSALDRNGGDEHCDSVIQAE